MPRKKTPEEYVKECKEKHLDPPIEDYVNNRTKIKHKCKKGHIYEQTPTVHLSGHGCPYCSNSIKKTSISYYNECKQKGYDLPIEDYKTNRYKINHRCKYGHIYSQTPSNHLSGHGCPICKFEKLSQIFKRDNNQYYNECKAKGYDLPIEDYKNNNTKIKHKCSKGHIYNQRPGYHLCGYGCPTCGNERIGKKLRKTSADYEKECKEKDCDIPIEPYITNKTKIKYECKQGHVYLQTPSDHLQGHGCPICNESHGEKYIRNYLDKHSIKYKAQKKFLDLKDKKPLSYDFYLPDYGILIEYQGIQHYESRKFNGKDNTDLAKQQYHDKLKKEYAKKNHYRLLELHYSLDTQDKVNKYLERRIK